MELLLKLLIIYIFFAFFILGFILSKVKFNIKKYEYKNNFENLIIKDEKLKVNIFKINVGLFWFGFIKVFSFNLENDGVRIFGKKISYKKLKLDEPFKNINFKDLKEDFKLSEFKKWKLNLESLDLRVDVGFKNVLLTSLSIFIISTSLSFLVRNLIKKYIPKKYKYVINPHYRNGNKVDLSLNSIISINTVHIISILLKYKQRREKVYERASYRRSYENSYE